MKEGVRVEVKEGDFLFWFIYGNNWKAIYEGVAKYFLSKREWLIPDNLWDLPQQLPIL